jgi:hypothetical protein
LDKIVQYIASKEFAEGVKASPAILNYAYRPYWEVDPSVPEELKTSEVSVDIENARLRLAETYETITIDQETLAKTLQLDLATNRQQELTNLATKLQTDAENVQKAALICFSDLEACVSNTNRVLANLVAYDRKIIEPNPFSDGLVAYYPFNSNALDESGNDNNGTVNGATLTEDRFGKKNSAYAFNGNGNYIKIENSQLLITPQITLSVWIYPSSISNTRVIVGRSSYSNAYDEQYYLHILSDGRILFSIKRNSGCQPVKGWYEVFSNKKIPFNKWSLVTASWDENSLKVYINGQQNGSNSNVPKGAIDNCPSSSVQIGRWLSRHPGFYNGSMDDVRIYKRALSDSEIQQLYNNASIQTKNCKANLLDQKLEIPCVSVPNVVGSGADIYSLDLINTPFTKRFDVDVNTLKKHTFQDSCLANYSLQTGGLNLPCVNVPNDRDYVMKMQQRAGTLIFDLIDSK